MRRVAITVTALLAMLSVNVSSATAGDGRESRSPVVVWQHTNPDDTVALMLITSDGAVHHLTTTPSGQGGSESPRWGGRRLVYFDSDRAGGIHLFRVTTSHGRRTEQLTTTDGVEFSPTVTPDHRQIVFEHAEADQSGDGLFIAPNRTGLNRAQFRRLTTAPAPPGFDSGPDVSPNGRTIAFIRVLDEGNGLSAVFTVGIDGHGLRQVTPYSLNATGARWSPNGHALLFSSHADTASNTVSANIYVVGPDGSGRRAVTHEPPGSQSFEPDWSPDGRRIVFAHAEPQLPGVQLRTTSLDGSHPQVLYQGDSGSEDNPDWR